MPDNPFEVLFDGRTQRETEIGWQADRILKAAAIVECFLCDDDGYRNLLVCDHVDRTEVAARGIAKVRAALKRRAS